MKKIVKLTAISVITFSFTSLAHADPQQTQPKYTLACPSSYDVSRAIIEADLLAKNTQNNPKAVSDYSTIKVKEPSCTAWKIFVNKSFRNPDGSLDQMKLGYMSAFWFNYGPTIQCHYVKDQGQKLLNSVYVEVTLEDDNRCAPSINYKSYNLYLDDIPVTSMATTCSPQNHKNGTCVLDFFSK